MLCIPSVNSKYSSKATFEWIQKNRILFGFGIENRVFGTASFSGTLVRTYLTYLLRIWKADKIFMLNTYTVLNIPNSARNINLDKLRLIWDELENNLLILYVYVVLVVQFVNGFTLKNGWKRSLRHGVLETT